VIEPVREPAPSRASPPRLIYPSRQRDAAESQQFVARLTIDTDGYVVGVRLTHGLNRSADERAAAAVWRFRYSPATDDAGQPVQVVIEQSFLVE
jgi:outer membrane biosynthesis protein TonB